MEWIASECVASGGRNGAPGGWLAGPGMKAKDGGESSPSRKTRGPVALIGYMGSGKTTVGRSLAHKLERRFVDLDDEIERRADRSIPHIFASSGESHFRDLEHRTLRDTLERSDAPVVSCGGGIVVRPENRALLREARTVFLEEDLGVLFARTRGAGRPLRGGGMDEFEKRYRERLPLYRECAALTVAVAGRSQREVAGEVERWLKK